MAYELYYWPTIRDGASSSAWRGSRGRRLCRCLASGRRQGTARDRVAAPPRVSTYLKSDRRIPFNDDGIFRPYPELDD